MATGTVLWYGNAPLSWFLKETNLLADTIYVSLHTVTYVPAQDTDTYWSNTTNEVTGTGYTAGGQQITTDVLQYTAGTNVMKYDGDDMVWATSTISNARVAVIYNRTPATNATRPLLGYCVFNADVSTSAGSLTITWDSAGILTLTAA